MKTNKEFGVTWIYSHGQQVLDEHDRDTQHLKYFDNLIYEFVGSSKSKKLKSLS